LDRVNWVGRGKRDLRGGMGKKRNVWAEIIKKVQATVEEKRKSSNVVKVLLNQKRGEGGQGGREKERGRRKKGG